MVCAVLMYHWYHYFSGWRKDKTTTNNNLITFYYQLHISLNTPFGEEFFNFQKQVHPFSDKLLYDVIQAEYKQEVVQVVKDKAQLMMEDSIQYANFVLPCLQKCIARQMKDYDFRNEAVHQNSPLKSRPEEH